MAYHFGNSPGFPSIPNLAPIDAATPICAHPQISN